MVEVHDVALTRASNCVLMVQVEILLAQIGVLGALLPILLHEDYLGIEGH